MRHSLACLIKAGKAAALGTWLLLDIAFAQTTPCNTSAPCMQMMFPPMSAVSTPKLEPTASPVQLTSNAATPVALSVSAPTIEVPQVVAIPSASIPTPAASSVDIPRRAGSPINYAPPVFSPTAAKKIEDEPAHEPGQLLVLWGSEEMAKQGLAVLQERYQLRPRQRFNLGQLGFTIVMLALPSPGDALALRDRLRLENPEWVVDLNARSVSMQGLVVPDEASARLYAQQMLGLSSRLATAGVSTISNKAHAFRLGVIDTEIAPALLLQEKTDGMAITQRSTLGPGDIPAGYAHGSTVFLLLAAKSHANGFEGAAPPLNLFWASAMRLQNDKPSTNSLLLSVALDWLVGKQVALINMSLGGQGDEVLRSVVAKVLAKRVAIVAAVGNDPASDAPPVYPAAYAGVWAVTAVDAVGKRYKQANQNTRATLAAPGVELWVPFSGNKDSCCSYVSGTSFAAALTSATLAWQPATFWTLTFEQQKMNLCAHAKPVKNDESLGCGVLQAQYQTP